MSSSRPGADGSGDSVALTACDPRRGRAGRSAQLRRANAKLFPQSV